MLAFLASENMSVTATPRCCFSFWGIFMISKSHLPCTLAAVVSLGGFSPPPVPVSQCSFKMNDLQPFLFPLVCAASVSTCLLWWEDVKEKSERKSCGVFVRECYYVTCLKISQNPFLFSCNFIFVNFSNGTLKLMVKKNTILWLWWNKKKTKKKLE